MLSSGLADHAPDMLIAQISDTHIAADGTAAHRRERALEHAVRHLNGMRPAPLAVIHTGDIAHNGRPREYDVARRVLSVLRLPLVLAVGNRDERPAARAAFPELDRRLGTSRFVQYAEDLGPVRLLVLDTTSDEHGLGQVCDRRQQEAHSLLSGLAPPIIVVLHHPPAAMPTLYGAPQFRDASEAKALSRLIARHPGVIGILAGHIHREDVAPIGATHVTTAPSLAVDLRKGRYGVHLAASTIFQVHEIGARGLKTARVVIALEDGAQR